VDIFDQRDLFDAVNNATALAFFPLRSHVMENTAYRFGKKGGPDEGSAEKHKVLGGDKQGRFASKPSAL